MNQTYSKLFECIVTNTPHYRSIRDLLVFSPPDKSRKAQTPSSVQVRLRSLCSLHLNNHHWFAVHIRLDSRRQIARFYVWFVICICIYACKSRAKQHVDWFLQRGSADPSRWIRSQQSKSAEADLLYQTTEPRIKTTQSSLCALLSQRFLRWSPHRPSRQNCPDSLLSASPSPLHERVIEAALVRWPQP